MLLAILSGANGGGGSTGPGSATTNYGLLLALTSEAVPASPSVGSSMSGGTFSRGRWRRMQEELAAKVEADARKQLEARQAKESAERAQREAKAAARKAARDAAAEEGRKQAQAQAIANAPLDAKLVTEAIELLTALSLASTAGRNHETKLALAKQADLKAHQEALDREDEERAIEMLLLQGVSGGQLGPIAGTAAR